MADINCCSGKSEFEDLTAAEAELPVRDGGECVSRQSEVDCKRREVELRWTFFVFGPSEFAGLAFFVITGGVALRFLKAAANWLVKIFSWVTYKKEIK